jgi:hypothetical protein
LASSYLEGGPRALWTNVYEAYKRANGGAEPPNPRQFFRQTLEANYGLQDLDQKYWDTWNSLRMGPSESVTEYNVDFQQALTDLAGHVTDKQVKIEKTVQVCSMTGDSCAGFLQPVPDGLGCKI